MRKFPNESTELSQPISNLFSNLSTYYRNENDLSNVTVSLCNSSVEFLRLFVHYFFPKLKIEDVVSVDREVWDEYDKSSRVDIMINLSQERYLVEVKINDKQHHFGQYERDFDIDSSHLGYIANYELSRTGYDIKQWKDFYYYLKDKLQELEDDIHFSLIYGYMQFLKSVCNFTDYDKPMKLKDIQSIPQFFEIVSSILSYSTESYEVTVGKLLCPTSGNRLAPYMRLDFSIQFSDSRRKEIPMSIYLYLYDEPLITISVDPSSNARLAKKFNDEDIKQKGKYFDDIYLDGDDWYSNIYEYRWFDMKQCIKFLESEDLKEQQTLLSKYIKEVIEYCVTC